MPANLLPWGLSLFHTINWVQLHTRLKASPALMLQVVHIASHVGYALCKLCYFLLQKQTPVCCSTVGLVLSSLTRQLFSFLMQCHDTLNLFNDPSNHEHKSVQHHN